MTNITTPDVKMETSPRRARRGLWLGAGIVILFLLAIGGSLGLRSVESRQMEDGRAAINSADWGVAVAAFDQALALRPAFLLQHTTEATALRGVAHYQQGDEAAAMADIDNALEQNPNLVDLYVYRADINYRAGEYEAALADCEAALAYSDLLPDHLEAMLYADRAIIYQMQGEDENILADTNAALALADNLPDDRLARLYAAQAVAAYHAGDPELALADTRTALAFDSNLPVELSAELHMIQAVVYYEQGDYTAAMMASDAALATADSLPEESLMHLHTIRADIYLRRGDLDTAVAEADNAAAYNDDLALPHAVRAWRYYRQFNEAEALEAVAVALELDETSPLAYRVRGSILAWQGKTLEALADLDRAIELEPGDVEALAMRVYARLELDDIEGATADAGQALTGNPNHPAALWAEAMIHLYRYELEEAHALLIRAIKLDDSRPEFFAYRGVTYRLTAQMGDARTDLDQALSLNPDFAPALAFQVLESGRLSEYDQIEARSLQIIELRPAWYLGYALLAAYYADYTGDLALAMAYAEQAIERRPELAFPYETRGWVYFEQGDYELARSDFEKALQIRPNSLSAISGLISIHVQKEEYSEALVYAEERQAIAPKNLTASVGLGRIHALSGNEEEAWESVYEALAADPDHPGALALRAYLWVERGEFASALADLSRVMEIYPKDGEIYDKRSALLFEQGDWSSAKRDALQALELYPKSSHPHHTLALITLNEGDLEEAVRQAELLVEKAPDVAVNQEFQGWIYLSAGRYEEAIASLAAGLALEESDILYYNRGLAYMALGQQELARADLVTAMALTDDVNLVAQIELDLATSSSLPVAAGDQFVITDEDLGYTIRYPDRWQPQPVDPDSGVALTLELETETVYAVANVVIFEDIPVNLTTRDLADALGDRLTSRPGYTSLALESAQVAGENGLVRQYELVINEDLVARGQQYYVVIADKAAVINFETLSEDYATLVEEFEAIIASFAFLP